MLTLAQVGVLCGVIYLVFCCIKLKHTLSMITRTMDCDELIEKLLAEPTNAAHYSEPTNAETTFPDSHGVVASVNRKRARLAALAAGGQARMSFKGRPVTPERVDAMEDAEIEELHARHEARLGAAMSKSLGSSLLRMYTSVASKLLPLPPSRQPGLLADLEQDPFVSSALQSACCELYYRYGMYLAPLTTALTTAKHCDWGWSSTVEHTVTEADNVMTNDGCSSYGARCGDHAEGQTEGP